MSRRQPDQQVDAHESDRSGYAAATGHDTPEDRFSDPVHKRSSRSSNSLGTAERSVLSVSGICLLTATKATDALTTGIGVIYVPGIYEANPVVAPVLKQLGVGTGLIISSFVVLAGIIFVTEIAALTVAVRRFDGHLAPLVRLVGYGIPSVLFAVVSLYNIHVLLAGIEASGLV